MVLMNSLCHTTSSLLLFPKSLKHSKNTDIYWKHISVFIGTIIIVNNFPLFFRTPNPNPNPSVLLLSCHNDLQKLIIVFIYMKMPYNSTTLSVILLLYNCFVSKKLITSKWRFLHNMAKYLFLFSSLFCLF